MKTPDISLINGTAVSTLHVLHCCQAPLFFTPEHVGSVTLNQSYWPCRVSDRPEDAEVAEDDDAEGDEEDEGEQQHCVGADWRSKCHVVPGTGGH